MVERIGFSATLFIERESPWENGYVESFNGKMRDELLNRELFYTLEEAQVLIEKWRREFNQVRPHSALGYRPPAPEAVQGSALVAPLMGRSEVNKQKLAQLLTVGQLYSGRAPVLQYS